MGGLAVGQHKGWLWWVMCGGCRRGCVTKRWGLHREEQRGLDARQGLCPPAQSQQGLSPLEPGRACAPLEPGRACAPSPPFPFQTSLSPTLSVCSGPLCRNLMKLLTK